MDTYGRCEESDTREWSVRRLRREHVLLKVVGRSSLAHLLSGSTFVDFMADAAAPQTLGSGTPKSRRRSGSSTGHAAEVHTCDSVQQVHTLPPRKEVNIRAFVLATDGELQNRGRGGKGKPGREVGSFVAGDDECLVQITFWSESAKRWYPKIIEWLDATEDGQFPEVEITACQVAAFRHPCSKELRRLQSTPRTQVRKLGASSLVVTPCAAVLTEDADALTVAPLVSCFQGIVSRVESLIHTHEDVPMKEIGVTMANGYEVPVMLYDAQTEEEVATKDAVAVWFGEHRAGLRDRAESKGMVWMFNSSYLLNLGATEKAPKGKPLSIGGSGVEEYAEADEEHPY